MAKYPKQVSATPGAILKHLKQMADPQRASKLQGYFKTGRGEYAEGDRFLGLTMPQVRGLVRHYQHLDLTVLLELLHSPWHEVRMLALLVLVHQFEHGNETTRKSIYRLYLDNTAFINNWDLVDSSAPKIVGAWLLGRDKAILKQLSRSTVLWERRIAILACFTFIREQQFTIALQIARSLLGDEHDLIHKAVGWMLREVGKRDQATEEAFLAKHYQHMPRTMLRYAIERLPQRRRQAYLQGRI